MEPSDSASLIFLQATEGSVSSDIDDSRLVERQWASG